MIRIHYWILLGHLLTECVSLTVFLCGFTGRSVEQLGDNRDPTGQLKATHETRVFWSFMMSCIYVIEFIHGNCDFDFMIWILNTWIDIMFNISYYTFEEWIFIMHICYLYYEFRWKKFKLTRFFGYLLLIEICI